MSIDNVRVGVNKQYHEIYQQLVGRVTHYPKIFPQHADVFTLCACVGYRTGQKTSEKTSDLFWSHSFSAEQETVLKALAVRVSADYTMMEKPEAIISLVEGYADAGMQILLDKVLVDFLRKDATGALSLDYNENSQLEKTILGFVQSELATDPLAM